MMSLSTKTVQTEVSRTGTLAWSDRGPISSSPTPVTSAAAERKRPVPAAHLSFIEKSMTEPSGPTLMALVSFPPISMTVPVARAAHVPGGLAVEPGRLARLDEGVLARARDVGARRDEDAREDRARFIHDDRLGLGGPDVDSSAVDHEDLLDILRYGTVIGRRSPAFTMSSALKWAWPAIMASPASAAAGAAAAGEASATASAPSGMTVPTPTPTRPARPWRGGAVAPLKACPAGVKTYARPSPSAATSSTRLASMTAGATGRPASTSRSMYAPEPETAAESRKSHGMMGASQAAMPREWRRIMPWASASSTAAASAWARWRRSGKAMSAAISSTKAAPIHSSRDIHDVRTFQSTRGPRSGRPASPATAANPASTRRDRKSTRQNFIHGYNSYDVF